MVDFQDNAWVDERGMLRWLQNQWQVEIDFQAYLGQYRYTPRNTIPRMLVLDVHKAQKTQAVKDVNASNAYSTSNGSCWLYLISPTPRCLSQ